ncbi:MAG: CocE/NonD family hydrolase [Alphaproteobacteria bacterium]|nr:CocE/NonD family hydrolase [Alphaproteobacteria bacterium]
MLQSKTRTDDAIADDVAVESDVMVPMRDGFRLATDIYRPASGGKPLSGRFPVILERTPYGKAEISRSERTAADPRPRARADIAAAFVRHGYVVVYQDVRGRYGSEGSFVKYLSDGADGYDTLSWLVAQPWCDGKVGTMGLSYAAHTQSALACLDPPGLAAMFLDSGGFSNAYQGGIRQGGAFELKQATWAFNNALLSPELAATPAKLRAMRTVDLRSWFARMPWSPGHSPLALAPDYEAYLFEQWRSGTFDDFWKQVGIYAEGSYEAYADVPMVHMSSWYDPYPRTATDNYLGLRQRKQGPVRLILGPWTHGDRSVTYAGDVDFGPDAALDGQLASDFDTLRRRWFDRWLRGIDNGVDREPAVRLFVMGGGSGRRNREGRLDHGGCWHQAADWPLPGTQFVNYYLRADGTLDTMTPTEVNAARRFDYDPRRPVPTIGGAISSGEPLMVGGAFDQVESERFFGCTPPYRQLAERPDVLVFQTPPLDQDVEVAGPIVVRLWISSNCPDTDFTAKLIDVHPPNADYPHGFAMNLTDGILRVRYRDSWERPALMTAGDTYRVEIAVFPTANRFVRGHRIRLDISSSNFPRFDLNPNTGEPEGAWRETRVATNTVFVDRDRPSHVVLPVVALSSATGRDA